MPREMWPMAPVLCVIELSEVIRGRTSRVA